MIFSINHVHNYIFQILKDEIWPNPLQYFLLPEVEEENGEEGEDDGSDNDAAEDDEDEEEIDDDDES